MNYVVVVKIVHSLQDFSYGPSCIFLSKLAILTDAVEEFPARSELGDNVVLVLMPNQYSFSIIRYHAIPSTRTNHETAQYVGALSAAREPSHHTPFFRCL